MPSVPGLPNSSILARPCWGWGAALNISCRPSSTIPPWPNATRWPPSTLLISSPASTFASSVRLPCRTTAPPSQRSVSTSQRKRGAEDRCVLTLLALGTLQALQGPQMVHLTQVQKAMVEDRDAQRCQHRDIAKRHDFDLVLQLGLRHRVQPLIGGLPYSALIRQPLVSGWQPQLGGLI